MLRLIKTTKNEFLPDTTKLRPQLSTHREVVALKQRTRGYVHEVVVKTPQYDARHARMTVVQGQEVIERSRQRVVVADAVDVQLCDPDWQSGLSDDVKPMLKGIFINNYYACEYAPPSDFASLTLEIFLFQFNREARGILDLAPLTRFLQRFRL